MTIDRNGKIYGTFIVDQELGYNGTSLQLLIDDRGLTWGDEQQDNPIILSELKLEEGNKPTDWTPAPEDYDDTITTVTNLYYASDSSTPPTKPNAHVGTNSTSSYNQWNIALPTYNESYPYLYTCKETLNKGGTYAWTTVEQTTYVQATKELQDDIAGIQADYLTNTSFVEYKRTQADDDSAIRSRLSVSK